jgi:hypothetical protein
MENVVNYVEINAYICGGYNIDGVVPALEIRILKAEKLAQI